MSTAPTAPAPTFTFVESVKVERVIPLDDLKPRITTLAADLRSQVPGGAVVGLMFRSEPILVLAWLAALHAGLRPLIMQYPTKKQSREYWFSSVQNTIDRAELTAVICDEYCNSLGLGKIVSSIVIASFDDIKANPKVEIVKSILPENFSIVQLSSGTTGFRKAVEFKSDDLRVHASDFNKVIDLRPERDRVVSWLPLYHDMGYVACFVMPLLLGIDVVMIDPMVWVREPALLFHAIEKHGGTIAYQPNFGFEVMSRVEPRPLPSMRFWISCSEPVSAVTSRRFVARMQMREECFAACYAMAENIFAVSMSRGISTRTLDGRDVVSCGKAIPGVDLKIVDDEIWARSPTSLKNYIGGDDIRDAAGYYPTGDLGALIDDELFVTGRKQDLIVQAGRKFMLSDIDLAVNEAFPEVKGRVAAIQFYDERLGTQKPVILIEAVDFYQRNDHHNVSEIVRDRMGLDHLEVEFVPPRFLTKTSSGKINRKKSAQDWAAHLAYKGENKIKQASIEDDLRNYYSHLDWSLPVREIMDSLSLTMLRIILNDAGVPYVPTASLNDFVNPPGTKRGDASEKQAEYIYIVSLVDRPSMKLFVEGHVEMLSRHLGAPVVMEHICLPPAAIVLSDLIFQDYFLPRVDREDYAVVERQLNKLRRASVILMDDAAEMFYPPEQTYGVLSHNLERDSRADLITVRWQRYPQMHHKLPLTVVSGGDLPLDQRTANISELSAYLDIPIFRLAGIRDMAAFTKGWEFPMHRARRGGGAPRSYVQPGALIRRLADWMATLEKPVRRQVGVPSFKLEMSDLPHFCSRFVDERAVDRIVAAYDRFCVVGQECSVPYLVKKLEAAGKSFIRSASYSEAAIGGRLDDFDCVVICGAQGRYVLKKPGVALMAADPPAWTWNIDDDELAKLNPVVPFINAPESGQDWYYAHPMSRGMHSAVFRDMRSGIREFYDGQRASRLERRKAVMEHKARSNVSARTKASV